MAVYAAALDYLRGEIDVASERLSECQHLSAELRILAWIGSCLSLVRIAQGDTVEAIRLQLEGIRFAIASHEIFLMACATTGLAASTSALEHLPESAELLGLAEGVLDDAGVAEIVEPLRTVQHRIRDEFETPGGE